jgi:hypothetical protein
MPRHIPKQPASGNIAVGLMKGHKTTPMKAGPKASKGVSLEMPFDLLSRVGCGPLKCELVCGIETKGRGKENVAKMRNHMLALLSLVLPPSLSLPPSLCLLLSVVHCYPSFSLWCIHYSYAG